MYPLLYIHQCAYESDESIFTLLLNNLNGRFEWIIHLSTSISLTGIRHFQLVVFSTQFRV